MASNIRKHLKAWRGSKRDGYDGFDGYDGYLVDEISEDSLSIMSREYPLEFFYHRL